MYLYKSRLTRLLACAKCRSKKKDIPFNLTLAYLICLWDKNKGKCILTGRPFELTIPADGMPHNNSPSVDRIVPSKGYTKGNIRLVIYQMNMALGHYGLEQFEKLIQDYQGAR